MSRGGSKNRPNEPLVDPFGWASDEDGRNRTTGAAPSERARERSSGEPAAPLLGPLVRELSERARERFSGQPAAPLLAPLAGGLSEVAAPSERARERSSGEPAEHPLDPLARWLIEVAASFVGVGVDAGVLLARQAQTEGATANRASQGDRHRDRARALRDEGLSVPQIGLRMATEDGRPDNPYRERVVGRWLAPRATKG